MDIAVDRRVGWLVVAWLVGCGGDGAVTTEVSSSSSSSSESSSSSSTGTTSPTTSADGSSSESTTVDNPIEGTTESSEGGSSTGSSSEGSTTGDASTSESSSEGTSSSGEESSSSSPGGTDPGTETGPMCGAQPNDTSCLSSCDCASEACYELGILGGVCGECLIDDDCPVGGCSIPNPLSNPLQGAVCNDGSLGGGCQTDEACQAPLLCVTIIDAPGILTNTTCSECVVDGDCPAGELCSPDYDILDLGGAWICVEPGELPNGQGCDLAGSGDEACASGFCATADVMGVLELGVCGECEVDADCTMGTCSPPEVDLTLGLVPSVCG